MITLFLWLQLAIANSLTFIVFLLIGAMPTIIPRQSFSVVSELFYTFIKQFYFYKTIKKMDSGLVSSVVSGGNIQHGDK